MTRLHLAGLALLFLVCGLALAACGSNGTSSAPATTTTGTSGGSSSSSASFAKYTACLKQHGVTRTFGPGGPNGGGGAPPANRPQPSAAARKTFQAAQTACAKYRPAGAGNGFPGRGDASSSAFAAYSNCLKLHGLTVTPGTRPAATSTKAKAALAACASLRPSPSSAPSSTNPSN
jgi:hypothetical protein